MGSAAASRVCAHPGAGACARLLDELEARTAAENAAIAARSIDARQRRWVASLGDGGFMTWRSSPFVMWLAYRLDRLGELAVAAVDDDLEAWRADLERRAGRP